MPSPASPRIRGAIKTFSFKKRHADRPRLDRAGNGLGFGPRHLDFHPTQPWVYVSIERQNQLYVTGSIPRPG